MHFILFIALLILFIWTGNHLLKSSEVNTKFFLLLAAISSIVLCTLMLFSFGHRKLDSLAVILLLITTAGLTVFFTTRKVR